MGVSKKQSNVLVSSRQGVKVTIQMSGEQLYEVSSFQVQNELYCWEIRIMDWTGKAYTDNQQHVHSD